MLRVVSTHFRVLFETKLAVDASVRFAYFVVATPVYYGTYVPLSTSIILYWTRHGGEEICGRKIPIDRDEPRARDRTERYYTKTATCVQQHAFGYFDNWKIIITITRNVFATIRQHGYTLNNYSVVVFRYDVLSRYPKNDRWSLQPTRTINQ